MRRRLKEILLQGGYTMIIPKDMLLQSCEGFEVVMSEKINTPLLICPVELYQQIQKRLMLNEELEENE